MTSQLLKNDEFLTEKQIEIERSSFLSTHYASKAFSLRQSYNPRDPYGSRLSVFWEPGDTKWSVISKKIISNVKFSLNPDTYSKETAQYVKKSLLKYKVEVVSAFLVVGIPIAIIYPMLRPYLKKIKRQFLFQYYLQSQLLAKRLQVNSVKLPVHEVQEIIRRTEAKIRL